MSTENSNKIIVDGKTYINGIVVWHDDETIFSLDKKDFKVQVAEGVKITQEMILEAQKQFYLYMVERKLIKQASFKALADGIGKEVEEYNAKALNVGKVLSAEDKLKVKKARLMKQLEALGGQAAELGIDLD